MQIKLYKKSMFRKIKLPPPPPPLPTITMIIYGTSQI